MDNAPQQLARKNLFQLWWLRNIALSCEAVILLFSTAILHLPLPIYEMLGILAAQVAVNAGVWWRLRQADTIPNWWVFFPLLFDVLALFCLLALSGGAANPFTSLFVLQVILSATLLAPKQTWQITAVAVACYSLLLAIPAETSKHTAHHGHGSMSGSAASTFDLHIYGMWGSFVILALLVAWFVSRMQATILRQNQLLAASEQLAVLGTVATSAAHELGTPLSSIALLADGLKEEADPTARKEQLSLLRGQIDRCKSIISQMALKAGLMRAESGQSLPARQWLEGVAQRWQQQHPSTALSLALPAEALNFQLVAEYTLEQAIINLLDNAADASPQGLSLSATQDRHLLHITVEDSGKGFPEALLRPSALQHPTTTSKPDGMGMGLYLSRMVAERLSGRLRLENLPAGGGRATLSLPLARITP